ncbi:hypothetical protein SSX86_012620 [Deinandra increscens subsp. villosa]|uniref:Uncharacterized protein n=1 Tax=Deinandra increscens subsp. villosa TaxID=3103831 RepID=A0AAP0H0T5_9ASTR
MMSPLSPPPPSPTSTAGRSSSPPPPTATPHSSNDAHSPKPSPSPNPSPAKSNPPPISPKLKSPRQPAVKRGGNNNDMTSSSDRLQLPLPTRSTTPKSVIPVKKSKKSTLTIDHDHHHFRSNSVDSAASTSPNSLAVKYSSASIVDSPGSIAAARREQVVVMQVQRKMRIAHYGRSKSAKFDSCSKLTSYSFDPNSLSSCRFRKYFFYNLHNSQR